jgi:hypothetical protein
MTIIAINPDGTLLRREAGQSVSCPETLEGYGYTNLTDHEKVTLNIHDTPDRKIVGLLGNETYHVERITDEAWRSVFPSIHAGHSAVHVSESVAESYIRSLMDLLGGTPILMRTPIHLSIH